MSTKRITRYSKRTQSQAISDSSNITETNYDASSDNNIEQEYELLKKQFEKANKTIEKLQRKISKVEETNQKKIEILKKENTKLRPKLKNFETLENEKENISMEEQKNVSVEDETAYDKEYVHECYNLMKEISDLKLEKLKLQRILGQAKN
uniref:Uncharacterized protein n=1 Tax=Panagrolaimus sp. PS1159 TaxID=55785 RepID=A0AC35GJP6_9BILA